MNHSTTTKTETVIARVEPKVKKMVVTMAEEDGVEQSVVIRESIINEKAYRERKKAIENN